MKQYLLSVIQPVGNPPPREVLEKIMQDIGVLQKIYWELDGKTALDCFVLRPGRVRVGDEVRVLDYWTRERSA